MTSKDKINNLVDMYNYENPLKTQQACKELLSEYPTAFPKSVVLVQSSISTFTKSPTL